MIALGYLMGLFQEKSPGHPIRALVYFVKDEEIREIDDLNYIGDKFRCVYCAASFDELVPEEAIYAYKSLWEKNYWTEHGSFDPETGKLRDTSCLVFTYDSAERSNLPNADDPGECLSH